MTTARAELTSLDHLWFQISGTVCNLACEHCFISCSPTNHTFELIPKEEVFDALEASRSKGVKEYYFTGGEPFIHPHLVEILERTLAIGPATVLTNGTLLKPEAVARLSRVVADSIYSLELRLSIDGHDAATNDPIRGAGTFERAMAGLRLLLDHGFLPIVTIAQTWEDGDEPQVLDRFVTMLRDAGYTRPRIKLIPTLRLGAEVARNRGYTNSERVSEAMLAEIDAGQLICTHSRVVTNRGVYVCPILLDSDEARMGSTLEEASGPFSLDHGACYTCFIGGAICTNASAGGGDVG